MSDMLKRKRDRWAKIKSSSCVTLYLYSGFNLFAGMRLILTFRGRDRLWDVTVTGIRLKRTQYTDLPREVVRNMVEAVSEGNFDLDAVLRTASDDVLLKAYRRLVLHEARLHIRNSRVETSPCDLAAAPEKLFDCQALKCSLIYPEQPSMSSSLTRSVSLLKLGLKGLMHIMKHEDHMDGIGDASLLDPGWTGMARTFPGGLSESSLLHVGLQLFFFRSQQEDLG